MKLLTWRQLLRFFRQTFLIGLALSVTVYIWVRLLFFEAPIQFNEEAANLSKVILTGWAMIMILKGIFYGMLTLGEQIPLLMAKHKFVGPTLLVIATSGVLLMFMW